VQYTCQDGKFTATLTLAGGTPPYTVNGKAAAGNTFTTDPVASGTALVVEAIDSLKCSFKTSVTHECCMLPCNGISVRRGYRFWIPEPDPQTQRLYEKFTPGAIAFVVDTAQGQPPTDLSAGVQPIITATAQDLNDSFAAVVKAWLGKINNLIAADARLNGGGKASWLTLSYESQGPGRLGTLWIEHFECLGFAIKITSQFTLTQGGAQSLTANYDATGTAIGLNDKTAKVPAFDGQQSDKCNPQNPVVTLCAGAQLPKLSIVRVTQSGLNVTFQVNATPDSPDLQFLWEVQDGNPALGNGRTFQTVFPNGANHLVMVTAYTKAGCSTTTSLQGPIG
jgi:hypothetical protein